MSDAIEFHPDLTTYYRSHFKLAAIAMAGAMAVLWLMGDPNIWVGAVAGLGAITLRGWFLKSEEMAVIWEIHGGCVWGPQERRIPLDQIEAVNTLGHLVQIVTKAGDKHLIKYQADPAATKTAIERAMP